MDSANDQWRKKTTTLKVNRLVQGWSCSAKYAQHRLGGGVRPWCSTDLQNKCVLYWTFCSLGQLVSWSHAGKTK